MRFVEMNGFDLKMLNGWKLRSERIINNHCPSQNTPWLITVSRRSIDALYAKEYTLYTLVSLFTQCLIQNCTPTFDSVQLVSILERVWKKKSCAGVKWLTKRCVDALRSRKQTCCILSVVECDVDE